MNNNNYCIAGFVKRAQQAGITESQALEFLSKMANGMDGQDPSAMLQQGAGSMAGDPNQSVPPNMAAPQGGAPQGQGIPPELEQMISQLPPEVLAQLVQEIEAEMQGGQGGGAQPPHHGGHHAQPPVDPS